MMDASLLLPPTATPLTGIEFSKRLPCGEEERARRVSACVPYQVGSPSQVEIHAYLGCPKLE